MIFVTLDTYCGGIFTSKEGTIKSPSFPLFYKPNSNCLYIISTPDYDQLTVKFSTFDIEKSGNCYKDYILPPLDGKFPSKYGVKRRCGNEMHPMIFKDRAWIEFFSDDSVQRAGFVAQWKAEKVVRTTTMTTTTTPSTYTILYLFVTKVLMLMCFV